jgi:hypothetical protein
MPAFAKTMSGPPSSRSIRAAASLTEPMSRWSAVTASHRRPAARGLHARAGLLQVRQRRGREVEDRADGPGDIDPGDRRSSPRQRHRGLPADAASRAGDDGDPAVQAPRRPSLRLVCHG